MKICISCQHHSHLFFIKPQFVRGKTWQCWMVVWWYQRDGGGHAHLTWEAASPSTWRHHFTSHQLPDHAFHGKLHWQRQLSVMMWSKGTSYSPAAQHCRTTAANGNRLQCHLRHARTSWLSSRHSICHDTLHDKVVNSEDFQDFKR